MQDGFDLPKRRTVGAQGSRLMTIGHAGTGAEGFFARLADGGVRAVIDVRLRPSSQFAGFAKGGDLRYFLRRLCGIDYRHEPLLAPTAALLADYRAGRCGWDAYAKAFDALLRERRAAARLDPAAFADACLLCAEAGAERCHRRLAAEHLAAAWPGRWRVVHL